MTVELLRANQAITSQIRVQLVRAIRLLWVGAMLDLSDFSADRWVRSAVPTVQGAMLEMTNQQRTYLSMVADLTYPTVQLSYPRGVDIAEVYFRPVATARAVRAAGHDVAEAMRRGANRAQAIATTDLQLAKTHSARTVLADADNVVGYRRVLQGPESCGLCIAASTRRYKKAELMPLHNGCDCDVAPLIGDEDPGEVVNREALDAFYDAGGEAERTTIYEHGEHGRTLAVQGQRQLKSTDPADRPDVKPPDDEQGEQDMQQSTTG